MCKRQKACSRELSSLGPCGEIKAQLYIDLLDAVVDECLFPPPAPMGTWLSRFLNGSPGRKRINDVMSTGTGPNSPSDKPADMMKEKEVGRQRGNCQDTVLIHLDQNSKAQSRLVSVSHCRLKIQRTAGSDHSV